MNGGSPEHKRLQLFFCKKQVRHVFFYYKWAFYFALDYRRMVDTKLTPSRPQQTVAMKYEGINAKTGKHGRTEKTVCNNIVRITGCHLSAY